MTGRATGFCAGFGGWGKGWRNRFIATGKPGWARAGYAAPCRKPDPEGERTALKRRAEALRSELDFMNKRLNEIDPGADTE